MTDPVSWSGGSTDGDSRTGTMSTPHGNVPTPNFMAVGTRASVKLLDTEDLERLGADIVLANTYHLMLRPGAEIVRSQGELHGFMSWDGPILTDSGGYQVLSLSPRISEDSLAFKSTYDGSPVELTPERSIAVQEALGSDIAMVLDVPVGLPADRTTTRLAMEQTLRWAERSKAAKTRSDRALFGIVQGGQRRTFAPSPPGGRQRSDSPASESGVWLWERRRPSVRWQSRRSSLSCHRKQSDT